MAHENTFIIRLDKDIEIPLKTKAVENRNSYQGLASKIIRDWLREQAEKETRKQSKKR